MYWWGNLPTNIFKAAYVRQSLIRNGGHLRTSVSFHSGYTCTNCLTGSVVKDIASHHWKSVVCIRGRIPDMPVHLILMILLPFKSMRTIERKLEQHLNKLLWASTNGFIFFQWTTTLCQERKAIIVLHQRLGNPNPMVTVVT